MNAWERVFAGAVIALASSALLPLLRSGGSGSAVSEDSGSSQFIWLAVYAVMAWLLLSRRPQLGAIVKSNPLLALFCALVLLSVAWSDVPELTARKAATLALTTLFAMYLASRFSVAELGDVLAWTLLAIALVSVAFVVLRPQYGLDHLRGNAWRGVFVTKNELGRIMALGAIVWMARALTLRGHLVVSLLASGFCAFVAERSGSRTALVVLLLFALLFLFLPAFRAHHSIAIPAASLFLLIAIAGGFWLSQHADAVLASVGTDSSFTGRDRIWSAVWTMIGEHPWLGYGYSAFWRGLDGPSAYVWSVVGTTPPHAHNGLLDVWLQLGLAGVLVAVALVTAVLRRAANELRHGWSFQHVLPFVLVSFTVFFNVSESSFAGANSLFWLLFAYACIALTRDVRSHAHVRAASGALARPAVVES